jgi:CRISPR-associated Cas5-like protein
MDRKLLVAAVAACATFASAAGSTTGALPAGMKGALDAEPIGLLPAGGMRLDTGKCGTCTVPNQGLWYFENELIAVPGAGVAVSGFTQGAGRKDDVGSWGMASHPEKLAYPSLVWIGASSILEGAVMLPGARRVRTANGSKLDIRLVPKLATNLSYANDKTAAYFAGRAVRMRGTIDSAGAKKVFIAHTIWPSDFALEPARLQADPLRKPEDLAAFVREPVGKSRGIETRLLWERHPGQPRDWKRKPVLGFVLNGAQGDDDESLGGHFAVATGRIGDRGEWSGWAVNNFYNLDSVSEKGIIAATLPMDNYLLDLNSGQQYYRPSWMLVAVLNNERTAAAFQGGVQRVMNHFYRHDFQYRHATANCAGISLDVFDSLGWHIPRRGPTGPLKSLAAYAYVSAKDGSLQGGRKIYDYLNEEQTRLLPAVAFEAAGLDLLRMVGATGTQRALNAYEHQLVGDVDAVFLVRIPQVPSSRATGSAPVFSFDEFRARVPADQAEWKIVPVAARPFPAALRDPFSVAEADPFPVPLPIAAIGACAALAAFAIWRHRARSKAASKQAAQVLEELLH